MSYLEAILATIIKAEGIEAPTREYRFCGSRRWRADMAWIDAKLLVEIEGGLFVTGRHQRAYGMKADMEKYNTATLMGFKVLRVCKDHIESGEAINWIKIGLGLVKND